MSMIPVKAKFHYSGIKTTDQGNNKRLCSLDFNPVYAPNPNDINHKFWKTTPSGKLELNFVNEEAVKQFELGKDYIITFTEA